jgi:hypothetical protein
MNEGKTKGVNEMELSAQQQEELEMLLRKYDNIFQNPTGLPPRRSRGHAITLVEGQGAVNVRPYRYPHHHKQLLQ